MKGIGYHAQQGWPQTFPWDAPNTPPADDYALANIGQAKALFDFDLSHFGAPPVVSIISPVNGDALYETETFDISWQASDPNGYFQSVTLMQGTSLLFSAPEAQGAFTHSQNTLGNYSYQVTATDALQQSATAQVNIVVDFVDSEPDGMDDRWELDHGLNPNIDDSELDEDDDTRTNGQEWTDKTDPTSVDSDGDGITDGGENDQGTDPNDPEDTPDAEWFILTGDLDEDEIKTRSRTVTIPAGESRVIAVVIASEEYPDYTGGPPDYNDTLQWSVRPAGGQAIAGSLGVNSRHGEWEAAELAGRAAQGFNPAHFESGNPVTAEDSSSLSVEIDLSATNVGDDILPSTVMVALLPVDFRVDADRDGEDDILGDSGDIPSVEKPYRFWVNDDHDNGNGAAATDDPDEFEEVTNVIQCTRDLEDYVRLHLDLSALKNLILAEKLEIGFHFVDVTEGLPGIDIYPAVDTANGTDGYLFDSEVANQQIEGNFARRVASVRHLNEAAWLNIDTFQHLSSNGHLHLIFDGESAGAGNLALLVKGEGIPEIAAVKIPMEILSVRDMYEHWTAGDNVDTDLAAIPLSSSKTDDSGSYDEDSLENGEAIVFVHGWRMLPDERRAYADTSFKRLWHQGYNGRFFHFSWPTEFTETENVLGEEVPIDKDNYVDSEEKAYHVGRRKGVRQQLLTITLFNALNCILSLPVRKGVRQQLLTITLFIALNCILSLPVFHQWPAPFASNILAPFITSWPAAIAGHPSFLKTGTEEGQSLQIDAA